jgi:hypothetical protein
MGDFKVATGDLGVQSLDLPFTSSGGFFTLAKYQFGAFCQLVLPFRDLNRMKIVLLSQLRQGFVTT